MTRKEYMDKNSELYKDFDHSKIETPEGQEIEAKSMALYREYMAQFVTPATIRQVVSFIGKDRILSSTDVHMNDIPLHIWDNLSGYGFGDSGKWTVLLIINTKKIKECDEWLTASTLVSVAKEAARQFKEVGK